MTHTLHPLRSLILAALIALAPSLAVVESAAQNAAQNTAETSTSTAKAEELVKLLDQMKLDSVAAAGSADHFIGALYLPGSQLLVVSGKFAFSDRPTVLIERKLYRDVYTDLSGAAELATKVLYSDLGANGLKFRRESNQPFDTVDMAGKSYIFDGDWRRAKLSREEYTKAFTAADEQYAQMLQTLINQLKKSS